MRGARVVLGISAVLVLASLVLMGLGITAGTSYSTPRASATGPSYNATFGETGLPGGTNWSVHVGFIGCGCSGVHTTVTSSLTSIVIPLPNGSYKYNILKVPGFVVVGLAHGTIVVSGAAPAEITATFAPIVTYTVGFTETGLPPGTSWTVHVSGNGQGQSRALEQVTITADSATLNFSLPNATYRYTVERVNGSFLDGPGHGAFVVAGAALPPIPVQFVTPTLYSIEFVETGLLAGASWSVAVHGHALVPVHEVGTSTGSTIAFFLPNGTFYYRIAGVLGYILTGSSTGSVVVAGSDQSVAVPFEQAGSTSLFLVDFNESGLTVGTGWTVRIAAEHDFGRGSRASESSTGTTLSFALQNGSYRYHIAQVRGYLLNVSSGVLSVAGASPSAIAVTFVPIPTYTVTFNESGLPNGTDWSVRVYTQNGAWSAWPIHIIESTTVGMLTFTLPNGTYCFHIYPVHGWHITTGAPTGSFEVVNGPPATVSVVYTPVH